MTHLIYIRCPVLVWRSGLYREYLTDGGASAVKSSLTLNCADSLYQFSFTGEILFGLFWSGLEGNGRSFNRKKVQVKHVSVYLLRLDGEVQYIIIP